MKTGQGSFPVLQGLLKNPLLLLNELPYFQDKIVFTDLVPDNKTHCRLYYQGSLSSILLLRIFHNYKIFP